MSFLSNLFGGANQASQEQTMAMLAGLQASGQNATTANTDLTKAAASATAPYAALQPTMAAGTGALGNALGLNGPAGSQSALAQLQTTPGYQFSLGAGNNAINAAGAVNGTLGSGNQQTALANYDQGLAQNTYSNYVTQLQPYLTGAENVAGGISGVAQNLGNQQAGVENQLTQNQLGLLGGIGNAQASASLANQAQSQNWLTGGGKAIGGLLSSPTSGTVGSSLMSGIGSIFSDERLKEDIQTVGELFDGTNIYRYRYKGDPVTRIGVMAQEVQETNPDAVTDIGGFLAVDYGKATNFASELGGLLEAA